MNLKFLSLISLCTVWLTASAANTNIYYNFTVPSGYTLTNVYIIDTQPSELFASFTSITNDTATPNIFVGPANITGSISGTTFGGADGNYLTLFAVFTNTTDVNVAVSVPNPLGGVFVLTNASWNDYSNLLHFGPSLPGEVSILSDLETGSLFNLAQTFAYLQPSSPVLAMPGSSSTIVAFDGGAQNAGSFSFSLTPILTAPSLSITHLGNQTVISWPLPSTDWTLQTNDNLVTGKWGNYLGPVSNNIETNSPLRDSLFFRLIHP
jgi:hypothetical protein